MIQNVDWDLVYNDAIEASGGYPTFPPPPAPAGGAAPTPAPAAAAQGAGGEAGDVATSDQFTVESHDIFFAPTEIEVPSDTEVTILLPNLGAAPHNFSIDELDISVDIAPGETKEVTINAPEGEYEYYCNVPGHKEAGMVGTLISRPMASADQPATADEDAAADADQATAGSGRRGAGRRNGAERDRVRHLLRTERNHHPGEHRRAVHLAERWRGRRTTSRSTSWASASTWRRARPRRR